MRCYPEHFTQCCCCCCCSYLVIPIPWPPIPIPPPAAAPLTGFTCCPGPCEGPPGIIDPIIPADPGSPGCPPPSMLPSFPISVSTQETGGVWRKVLGQIGGVAFLYRYVLCFTYAVKKKKRTKKEGEEVRENWAERTQRCSSVTAIIVLILVSFSTSRLPPPDVMTGACRTATAAVRERKWKRERREKARLD